MGMLRQRSSRCLEAGYTVVPQFEILVVCPKLALLRFGRDRRLQLMDCLYVAFLVDGSPRFIGSGGLKLYEFVADVAGYSKLAVISHGRASP